jgi:hypothetical protein
MIRKKLKSSLAALLAGGTLILASFTLPDTPVDWLILAGYILLVLAHLLKCTVLSH